MKVRYSLFIWLALVVTACSAPGQDTIESATPTAETPAQAGASPASGSQGAPVDAVDDVIFGRNDDGTFFHGAPDAPVTLIDYSDFL